MTDTQLHLAIGVPVIANLAALLLVSGALNKRFDDLRIDLGRRIDEVVKRLDRIEGKMEDHERRITRVEERTPPLVRA